MVDISVIIVNYNTAQMKLNCISSLITATHESIKYEVIIIDNASTYADYEILKNSSLIAGDSRLQLYRERKNLGFGGGNMRGVHWSSGDYYAFINNDIIFQNDCLGILHEFLQVNTASVAGATQLDHNGNYKKSFDYFLSVKREFLGRSMLNKLQPARYPSRNRVYDSPLQVDCVPGSFMMVRASSFHKVGGFDLNQFLYFEETDLCMRILATGNNGYCYHVPAARYIHYSGSSTAKNKAIEQEMKLSRMYTLKKHSHSLSFIILYIYEMILYTIKSLWSGKARRLLKLYLTGFPLHKSLKQKQVIHER